MPDATAIGAPPLRRLAGGPCKPNGSDLLVRIDEQTGRVPDASVTGRREGRNSITEPVAIFEILSPATELLDRSDKRRGYQRLASLRHYVLIAQDAPRVEADTRTGRGWRFAELEGLEAELALDALDLALPLAELYDGPALRRRLLRPCSWQVLRCFPPPAGRDQSRGAPAVLDRTRDGKPSPAQRR